MHNFAYFAINDFLISQFYASHTKTPYFRESQDPVQKFSKMSHFYFQKCLHFQRIKLFQR
jgi:hypothetical protein